MCTLTIGLKRENVILTFNRDEQKSRKGEKPPHIQSYMGTSFYGPKDLQAGGTWVGVNMEGRIACLTNYYVGNNVVPQNKAQTRGSLVPKVLSAKDPINLISGMPLAGNYNGFCLFIIDDEIITRLVWTGKNLERKDFDLRNEPQGWLMFTTSSVLEPETKTKRETAFREWLDMGCEFTRKATLPSFHENRFKDDLSASVLMDRDIAHTTSITQIAKPLKEGGKSARVYYWANPQKNLDQFSHDALRTAFLPTSANEKGHA